MLVKFGVPKKPEGVPVRLSCEKFKAYTKTWSGVDLWSGAFEWSGFLEWRFGVTVADSDQENIWKSNHASLFRAKGHVLISALVWPDPIL